MPSVTLTDPVTGTTVASGLIATNNSNLRNLLNSGLDYVNLKGAPALVSGEVPVWNGAQFNRSSVTQIAAGSFAGMAKLDDQVLSVDGALNLTVPAGWKYGMLRVVAYYRSALAAGSDTAIIRFNADGSSTYSWLNTAASAGSVVCTSGTNTYMQAGVIMGNTGAAGYFSPVVFDIFPGPSSSAYKNIVGKTSFAANTLTDFAGIWPITSDLTSINLQTLGGTGSPKAGSRAILLGVS